MVRLRAKVTGAIQVLNLKRRPLVSIPAVDSLQRKERLCFNTAICFWEHTSVFSEFLNASENASLTARRIVSPHDVFFTGYFLVAMTQNLWFWEPVFHQTKLWSYGLECHLRILCVPREHPTALWSEIKRYCCLDCVFDQHSHMEEIKKWRNKKSRGMNRPFIKVLTALFACLMETNNSR